MKFDGSKYPKLIKINFFVAIEMKIQYIWRLKASYVSNDGSWIPCCWSWSILLTVLLIFFLHVARLDH